jgi:hypothetical protein
MPYHGFFDCYPIIFHAAGGLIIGCVADKALMYLRNGLVAPLLAVDRSCTGLLAQVSGSGTRRSLFWRFPKMFRETEDLSRIVSATCKLIHAKLELELARRFFLCPVRWKYSILGGFLSIRQYLQIRGSSSTQTNVVLGLAWNRR